jgi:hypothetical protein
VKLKSGSRKAVLLLGAGATRGAIRHVLLNQKRLRPPLNGDFFDVAATYARAKGSSTQKRVDHLRKVGAELALGRNPTLEEAFSLLYIAKDFPEIYKSGPGPKPEPGISSEIDDFLALLFGVLNEIDRGRNGHSGYDRLTRSLESGDSVLTLNYDTCLDSALRRAGWDPASGYDLIGGKAKCKWVGSGTSVSEATNAKSVKLLKLHGSMNWWVRGSSSDLTKVFSKKPTLITGPRRNGRHGYLRQIVPPIHGKFFSHRHWGKLWKAAFHALCTADTLVVIGCSIVDTDFHLQGFLRRMVKTRKASQRFREAVLVDRSVRVRRKWKKVLKGSVSSYQEFPSFDAFLEKGART